MKSSYEVRTSDEEGRVAPSDNDEGSNSKGDSSSDSNSSDSGHGDDNSNSDSEINDSEHYDSQYSGNDWGEPLSGSEYVDDWLYCEDYDDDVNYYDEYMEDNVKVEPIDMGSKAGSDQYKLENVLEATGEGIGEANNADYGRLSDWSYITNVSSKSSPQYDKHGREIPELGSFHNSELGSLIPYTKEEDDIDARLTALDQKLKVYSLGNITLDNPEDDNKKMEGNELEYLP